MARTQKRADSRYQKFFRFNGKGYTVYGKTPTEAEAAKAAKLAELAAGVTSRENPRLNDYYESFTEYRRNSIKESTRLVQAKTFRKCAEIVIYNGVKFGDMRIRDIKPKDVQTVQKTLEAAGNNASTINGIMTHLNHVFSAAVKDDTIDKNPCKSVERLRRTEPLARETIHRALSQEETTAFLEAAKDSVYINVFKLMLATGMRIGEVGALTEADIDKSYIHVTKTVTRSEYGQSIIGDSPKTKDSNRDIPLTDTTREILRQQRKLNETLFGTVDLSKPLFRSLWGRLLSNSTLNREIKTYTDQINMECFSSHSLRATFATRFIEQRPQDYKILSEILGHADISITLNLYTHVMDENKIAAMQAISIAL